MRFVRREDLMVEFGQTDLVTLRSAGAGIEVTAPAQAVPLIAYCSEARTRDEVVDAFGPMAGRAFDILVEGELLVREEEALDTPLFFQNFASIDTQRRMLEDRVRVDAYAEAIRRVVRPGQVVLDAGSGTGLLACMAALAGAERVYAVERSDAIHMAEAVVRATGVADRVHLVRADLRAVQLPEQVDVVVSETFGALALSEGGFADVASCAARDLRPGGVVIPSAVRLYLAPVRAAFDAFGVQHGVDLRPLQHLALRRGAVQTLSPEQLAAEGAVLARLPFPGAGDAQGEARFTVDEGPLVGFAAWFTLELAPGVELPTSPRDPTTHWQQAFLPVATQHHGAGELQVEVDIAPAEGDRRGLVVHTRWTGCCEGAARHRLV
ncbi:MAG: class I SAM-dependent methyltransferase [Deltaproteobacteria bacterium]|nr:class I SAM-dependent methyltransferase [Deltaproteobacteria bacterium]